MTTSESLAAQLQESVGGFAMNERTVTLSFPMPASYMTMNQRKHWRWVATQKKKWRETAHLVGLEKAKKARALRRNKRALVHFIFPVSQNRRRDPHNYYPTVKPIIDGLTDAGFWPDDTPEYVVTREPIFYKGPPGASVVIVVTPMEDNAY